MGLGNLAQEPWVRARTLCHPPKTAENHFSLGLPIFGIEVLALHADEDLLKPWWDGTHRSNPSLLRIPTNLSSAANAASALSRNRFMAWSTVSISCSTLGST